MLTVIIRWKVCILMFQQTSSSVQSLFPVFQKTDHHPLKVPVQCFSKLHHPSLFPVFQQTSSSIKSLYPVFQQTSSSIKSLYPMFQQTSSSVLSLFPQTSSFIKSPFPMFQRTNTDDYILVNWNVSPLHRKWQSSLPLLEGSSLKTGFSSAVFSRELVWPSGKAVGW